MLPDLVEGAGLAPIQPEAQAEDLPLAFVEGDEHLVDLPDEQTGRSSVEGGHRRVVFNDIAELGVAVLAQRLGERQRLGGVAEDLSDLGFFQLQIGGQLGDGGGRPSCPSSWPRALITRLRSSPAWTGKRTVRLELAIPRVMA